MKSLILLFLVGVHQATAVTHSLKYFYTGSSGIPNFPEFVTVGMVDEFQIDHYDSDTRRAQSKQDWMKDVIADDPQYLDRNTETYAGNEPAFKASIETAKQRFNQTGGVHVWQYMYGCEWDDETQEVTGIRQIGYDGEDFVVWDTNTNTWVAPKQQAVITKDNWNSDKADLDYRKNYLTQICPDWLKKYVSYGRSSLMKTVRPSAVSLLQKTPSSPVSCHATGFYPNKAMMFWRKNGEELHEDVDQGEILPNHDGTFQMSIELSSVKPEDWGNCECVFLLSGVEDIVTRLEKTKIKTNESSSTVIIIVIAVVVVLALVIGAVGFFIYKKKSVKRPPSPVSNPEVMEQLNPPTV